MLTIAHRLNTIIDYDRVIVLDKGCLMQFDTPYELIEQGNGIFYELFHNLSSDIRNELKRMANISHFRYGKINPNDHLINNGNINEFID